MAAGGVLWGAVANHYDIGFALLCASATLIVGMLVTLRLTLPVTEAEDINPSLHWPAPIPPKGEDGDRGPVMVTLEYSINPADAELFRRAMQEVRAMRRRSGALTWGLVQNTENPDSWLEFFMDGSWLEHMRHHGRVTKADRRIESAARRFQQPGVALVIKHHLMHVARR
jgi:quinol monooxygenase YgiN